MGKVDGLVVDILTLVADKFFFGDFKGDLRVTGRVGSILLRICFLLLHDG